MDLAAWLVLQRGRQAALAARLRIKPPQVAAWAVGKKQVPLDHCPGIQEFTDGQVTCEELRPDKIEYFALIRSQAERRVDYGIAMPFADLPESVRRQTLEAKG